MKKHKSLFFKSATKKRLLWVYLVTSIPLLVCILLGSEYGKRLLRQQSIQYNHNTLSLQLATVDTSLDHISNYLASFLLDENNYHGLQSGRMLRMSSVRSLPILRITWTRTPALPACFSIFRIRIS
mgnify:CR=1 FL=1